MAGPSPAMTRCGSHPCEILPRPSSAQGVEFEGAGRQAAGTVCSNDSPVARRPVTVYATGERPLLRRRTLRLAARVRRPVRSHDRPRPARSGRRTGRTGRHPSRRPHRPHGRKGDAQNGDPSSPAAREGAHRSARAGRRPLRRIDTAIKRPPSVKGTAGLWHGIGILSRRGV